MYRFSSDLAPVYSKDIKRMELGYEFDPLPIPEHPGSRSLTVRIAEKPTHKHYDPEIVRTTMITDEKLLATLVISHPWIGLPEYCLSAGLIRISDRRNEIVDAFTLGGTLKITREDSQTSLVFESSAPIFPKLLSEHDSFQIANQIETLLAERRAIWAFDPEEYQQRLVQLKPENLYWLCIQELQERFSDRAIHNNTTETLSSFFYAEVQRLLQPRRIPLIVGTLSDYI